MDEFGIKLKSSNKRNKNLFLKNYKKPRKFLTEQEREHYTFQITDDKTI